MCVLAPTCVYGVSVLIKQSSSTTENLQLFSSALLSLVFVINKATNWDTCFKKIDVKVNLLSSYLQVYYHICVWRQFI